MDQWKIYIQYHWLFIKIPCYTRVSGTNPSAKRFDLSTETAVNQTPCVINHIWFHLGTSLPAWCQISSSNPDLTYARISLVYRCSSSRQHRLCGEGCAVDTTLIKKRRWGWSRRCEIRVDTNMVVVVIVAGACEWGVISDRVSYGVNMRAASREPALKYSNSALPVHVTRPGL